MVGARPLISVVDDEDSVRAALRRLLRSAGLDVESFASGAGFLESLQDHRMDCVVLDLHMPQVDGFAVLDRLTESGVRVPVIVITGDDTTAAQERAMAAGVWAYLRKPVDDRVLLEAIDLAIHGQRQQ